MNTTTQVNSPERYIFTAALPNRLSIEKSNSKMNSAGNLLLLKQISSSCINTNPLEKLTNPKLKKRIPKQQIIMDRESLYDENLFLKKQQRKLEDENKKQNGEIIQLKHMITQYEKTIAEHQLMKQNFDTKLESKTTFERQITDNMDPETAKPLQKRQQIKSISFQGGDILQGVQILNMRKQMKDLQTELQKKDSLIDQLKKDHKAIKIQELTDQLKDAQKECEQLRLISESENKLLNLVQQSGGSLDVFQVLKMDNNNLSSQIQEYNNSIKQLLIKIKQQENIVSLQKQKINLMEKNSMERDRDYQRMKQEFANPKNRLNREMEKEYKEKLEKKMLENQMLNEEIELLNIKIVNVEKKNKDLYTKYQVAQNILDSEKQQFSKKLTDLRKEIAQANQRLALLGRRNSYEFATIDQSKLFQNPRQNSEVPDHEYEIQIQQENYRSLGTKRKQNLVNLKDIDYIVQEMRIRLKSNRIKFNDIDSFITPINITETSISIQSLVNILVNFPFQVANDEEAVLIARYIIEDNGESQIMFDQTRRTELPIVKSSMKTLIKTYTLMNEQEINHMSLELKGIFEKFGQILKETLNQILVQKEKIKNQCDWKEFLQGLKQCDLNLNQKQLEYVGIKAVNSSENLKNININKLLEVIAEKDENN